MTKQDFQSDFKTSENIFQKLGACFQVLGKIGEFFPKYGGLGVGKVMEVFVNKCLVGLEKDFHTASQQGICAKLIRQIDNFESRLPVTSNPLGAIIVLPFFLAAKLVLNTAKLGLQGGRLLEQLFINPKDFYLKGILLLMGEPVAFALFITGSSLTVSGMCSRILTGNTPLDITMMSTQLQEHNKQQLEQHKIKRETVQKETNSPVAFFTKYNNKLDQGFDYLKENAQYMLPDKRLEFLDHIKKKGLKAPQELLEALQK